MKILGIETSCDETAISVIRAEGGIESPTFKILSHQVHSQIKEHQEFGGVVPNIAKREHQKYLPVVLDKALEEAGIVNMKSQTDIDLIAVTIGPGLEPALWTGIKFAEELAEKWRIPIVGANHMEGHIASVLLSNTEENLNTKIIFPAVALLISGGHTELILLENWQNMQKIGQTVDDAVGEAFDKVARMLGLPYPGGPQISILANEARETNLKLEKKFPRPMIHSKDYNFSFSGLKTAVLYYLKDNPQADKLAIAREFEDAVVETLISKTKKALEQYSPKSLVVGGGVIANTTIKNAILKLKIDFPELKVLIPEKVLATDNATMIAIAGYIEFLRNGITDNKLQNLKANSNLSL